MTDITEQAVKLGAAGYYVGPVSIRVIDGKKRPTFHRQWQTATDVTAIRELFDGTGATGVFIDTEKSGIAVIDLDVKPSANGFVGLEKAGISLPTGGLEVDTWSGGRHLIFRQPEGEPLGCHQGIPALGVDIRGLGGVIFGPGTTVHDGDGSLIGSYRVRGVGKRVEDLPRLPSEFAEVIRSMVTKSSDVSESTLQPYQGALTDDQRSTLERWYAEDLTEIRGLQDGQRHSMLLKYANRVVARGAQLGMDSEVVRDEIRGAYKYSGGVDLADLNEIIESATKWAADNPLPVPTDWVSPDEVRFEEAVAAEVAKLRIRAEAKRRATYVSEDVDLGRELDFSETNEGLFGKHYVKDVIPAGETTLVFSERNVGKSFLAMSLGLSVASGEAWYGRKVEQGNVLYLAGEGSVGLPARRRAWCTHFGLANPENFRLRDRIVRLANPASLEAWQKVIVDQEIDLVIIDTLRRAARGKEMENPGEAQEIIELTDDLRSVRHGCSALLLGHPTKSQPDQPAGAGTVQDSLPMIHRLVREGTEVADSIIDLITTKSKDGPTRRIETFAMKPVAESLVLVQQNGYANF